AAGIGDGAGDSAHGGSAPVTAGSGSDTIVGGLLDDTSSAGDGNNVVFGDSAQLDYLKSAGVLLKAASIADSFGANDTIRTGAGQDVVVGGAANDMIDAGAGNDLIAGDNASLDRTGLVGDFTSPLFRALSGTQIYDGATGQALVTQTWQLDPQGTSWWSDFRLTLLDLGPAPASNSFGDDYIAGGAGNDLIFGQNGDDVIQ